MWLIKYIAKDFFINFIQLLWTIPTTVWTYYKDSPRAKAFSKLLVHMSIDIIICIILVGIVLIVYVIDKIEGTNTLKKKKEKYHEIPIKKSNRLAY